MKKNFKEGLLITVTSLIFGLFAIGIPFKFFENLTSSQMTIMFVTEIIVYGLVGAIFLIIKQVEAEKKQQQKEYEMQRKAKISKLQTEWFDLVA